MGIPAEKVTPVATVTPCTWLKDMVVEMEVARVREVDWDTELPELWTVLLPTRSWGVRWLIKEAVSHSPHFKF